MLFHNKTVVSILLFFLFGLLTCIQGCDSENQNHSETHKKTLQPDREEQNKTISLLFDEALKADSTEDYILSIKRYSDILSIDKSFTGALINRATAYINLGDTSSAFNDLNRAVIYSPHEKTYYSRGTAFVYLNTHLNIAKEDLLKAIALNPDNSAAYYSLSMLELTKKQGDSCAFYLNTADKIGYNPAISDQIKSDLNKLKKKTKG